MSEALSPSGPDTESIYSLCKYTDLHTHTHKQSRKSYTAEALKTCPQTFSCSCSRSRVPASRRGRTCHSSCRSMRRCPSHRSPSWLWRSFSFPSPWSPQSPSSRRLEVRASKFFSCSTFFLSTAAFSSSSTSSTQAPCQWPLKAVALRLHLRPQGRVEHGHVREAGRGTEGTPDLRPFLLVFLLLLRVELSLRALVKGLGPIQGLHPSGVWTLPGHDASRGEMHFDLFLTPGLRNSFQDTQLSFLVTLWPPVTFVGEAGEDTGDSGVREPTCDDLRVAETSMVLLAFSAAVGSLFGCRIEAAVGLVPVARTLPFARIRVCRLHLGFLGCVLSSGKLKGSPETVPELLPLAVTVKPIPSTVRVLIHGGAELGSKLARPNACIATSHNNRSRHAWPNRSSSAWLIIEYGPLLQGLSCFEIL